MCLTVITPVLNGVSELERCFESTRDFCEHVFVDGGSIDGSLELLNKIGAKVVSCPGTSIYEAQNIGIENSAGDWCYFIGADDTIIDGAVNELLEVIKNCGQEVYLRVKHIYNIKQPRYTNMQQSWVYKKSLLIEHGGFVGKGFAEVSFNKRITDLPHRITNIVVSNTATGGISDPRRKQ